MKHFNVGTLVLCFLTNLLVAEDPPWPILKDVDAQEPLPGTQLLEMEGDLSEQLVDGVDRFLMKRIHRSIQRRNLYWADAENSVTENREELKRILGTVRDPIETDGFVYERGPVATTEKVNIRRVRWRAFRDVYGVGLILEPKEGLIAADVVVLPDADQEPEEVAIEGENRYALRLAEGGCRVLVPLLINRQENPYRMTNREWLHRPAFELGRTLVGYELNKVVAGIRCLDYPSKYQDLMICGWGEGGRMALYLGAILEGEPDLAGVCVSGYFGSRQEVWNEPADRNVFGLLTRFGDAEIAGMIGEKLMIEHTTSPAFVFRPDAKGEPEMFSTRRPNKNGKPGKLIQPSYEQAKLEHVMIQGKKPTLAQSSKPLSITTLNAWFRQCGKEVRFSESGKVKSVYPLSNAMMDARHNAQMREIEAHNQWALIDSIQERAKYFKNLNTSNLDAFKKTIEPYRKAFNEVVIGTFEGEVEYLPPNPRTRMYQEGPKTVSYEVVLDVFEDVIAYGVLTLPKDLYSDGNKKYPVVVCQHGLEGRPQDVIGEPKYRAYKAFATRLAEEGYITFSPQNLYLFRDKFRMQQFKANAVGKTLFSVMVPQHKVITNWLAELPYVDEEKIGFYGLSYGGKSAMRIPPLVDRYCLSICSADFNEWIWKNAATDPRSLRYSYANKGEYEIYEFNLGRTFNYSEMAALIAPRPFMVERGHFDGVAPDETVAYEFAKVRHLYSAKLGIPDKAEIEWFVGPHAINLNGTLAFLNNHLKGERSTAD